MLVLVLSGLSIAIGVVALLIGSLGLSNCLTSIAGFMLLA